MLNGKRRERVKEKYHATLQPSEMAIFQAAAQIFSSYAASGKVTDENEHEMILKAIKTSITTPHSL